MFTFLSDWPTPTPPYLLWLGAGLSLLFLARLLLWLFCRPTVVKTSVKLPGLGYQLIYTDTRGDQYQDVDTGLLTSEHHGLRGKPDAIYATNNGRKLVVAELKSGTIGDNPEPHPGDFMQLCAYFLIIEEAYGIKPKHGLLIYNDYMFKVKNIRRLRQQVLSVVADMRKMAKTGSEEPKAEFAACRYCLCRGTVCEFIE